MSYDKKGMRKLSYEEVKKRVEKEEIAGCYFLYSDGTESVIDEGNVWPEIKQHIDNGGEIGEEIGEDKEPKSRTERKPVFGVVLDVFLSDDNIDNIMVTALEGGICYWCDKVEVAGECVGDYASEQISRGGTLRLYDFEEENWQELTREKFIAGLKKYIINPTASDICEIVDHEVRIDTCQVDAEVADAIIQYAVFGDIIYG